VKSIRPGDIARLLTGTPLIIMLDIDGTLCDIVERADDARVPSIVRDALRALGGDAARDVRIAFVTGRSVADASCMLGIESATIYGNHGMERLSATGEIRLPDGWESDGARLRAAVPEFTRLVEMFPGTSLEDKQFSLTLHHRAMDAALLPRFDAGAGEIARRHDLRLAHGKCVINVLTSSGQTKGDAVLEFVRDSGGGVAGASILFAGDDVTDEDAFRALRNVAGAVTVHVGADLAGGAAAGGTCAHFSLGGPRDVHELLSLLAAPSS
jgi:trehalose 6-phosphate phosphatase